MMPTVHSTNSPSRPFQYHDKDAHAEADEASFESSSDTLFSNSLNHSSSYLPCKESYEQSIRVDIASDRYNYTQRDVSGSVSPMSAGSEWEERKRSRTVGILQLLREKASARCYYAAGAVAILLLVVSVCPEQHVLGSVFCQATMHILMSVSSLSVHSFHLDSSCEAY